MREYELIIDEALKVGLSPELTMPSNSQFLLECLGFRCGRTGLEPCKRGENPLPATIDMYYSWPFPQFISGKTYNLLIVRDTVNHEDAIYSISNDMSIATHVFSVDQLTFGQGTLMEVADFGEYAMMVNGVARVFWNVLGAWNASVATATIPLMRTICNFKGKAVGGGITSDWHDCDETFYIWSKVGQMDFTPDRRNTAGYRRCPFGGNVYHTRRLEDSVIGYSSKGIVEMFPVTDPAPTFGFRELHDVGLINRGAMDGNLREHVFVDSDYNIWKIGTTVDVGGLNVSQVNPKKLGYSYWMDELSDEDIIVNYDKYTGDFYIGNSKKTYLLSPNGLTEVPQHPSAVWRDGIDDDLYMLPDAIDDHYPLITSEVFDFGYKGLKTISVVETDAMLAYNAEAAVDYNYDGVNYGSSDWKPVNNLGVATAIASGNSFRFKLRFESSWEAFRISYIKVRYKMDDLRAIRGVYAPPLRGQS